MTAAIATRPDAAGVLARLAEWEQAGWLRGVDRALVRLLHEELPELDPLALLLAALASHQAGRGHVCLDLDALLEAPDRTLALPPEGEAATAVLPSEALRGTTRAELDQALADARLCADDAPGASPLVRARGQLYLRRYWEAERRVGEAVRARLEDAPAWREALDPAGTRQWLDRLFPATAPGGGPDWQRIACVLAAGSGFGVITGGPGTGKTTTVLRLLALLQGLQGDGEALRIRLAAPTGKAAARLNASVGGALDRLNLEALPDGERLRSRIPAGVVTLHRLLGARPGARGFRHDAANPLPVDVLVVDEASMIDLELMAALVEAVPRHARLILLGDRDQLASVEAGAVMGELCARASDGHYTPETVAWLKAHAGAEIPTALQDGAGQALDQHVVMLRHSHRFDADSGIGQLATAVNEGRAGEVRLPTPDGAVDRLTLEAGDGPGWLARVLDGDPQREAAGYRHYLEALARLRPAGGAARGAWEDWAREVLQAHGHFQLLCAVRRGPRGLEQLNRRIAAALRERGLLAGEGTWVEGRPVIVTRNDYALGLINGDIGIALAVPRWLAAGEDEPQDDEASSGPESRVLRVAFLATDGRVRWIPPNRLEGVESAFALTVHKAQGSEFDHVALILPDTDSPILTRELVYTAITRASRRFTLLEPRPGRLETAAGRRIRRGGGLHRWLEAPGIPAG
ncbi:exodeoxyribonuclease V subunit alpha [Thioalkalivibrio sp. ALgr3]|uniref:exodeoxyribonuclease V subunit alpha n=1 Tax=Thioalkalivibrio sp. ALgr3 TaxID=1239292 RepID=UPI00037886E0|nr:exodeoxyribonuclease V subunit alpha [Thioalkalivibrio sp. ALgr3]